MGGISLLDCLRVKNVQVRPILFRRPRSPSTVTAKRASAWDRQHCLQSARFPAFPTAQPPAPALGAASSGIASGWAGVTIAVIASNWAACSAESRIEQNRETSHLASGTVWSRYAIDAHRTPRASHVKRVVSHAKGATLGHYLNGRSPCRCATIGSGKKPWQPTPLDPARSQRLTTKRAGYWKNAC